MKTSNVKHRPAKNEPSFVTTLEHFSQPVGNLEAAEELIAMGGRLLFHDADVLMINAAYAQIAKISQGCAKSWETSKSLVCHRARRALS